MIFQFLHPSVFVSFLSVLGPSPYHDNHWSVIYRIINNSVRLPSVISTWWRFSWMCRSIICFKFILNQLIERHAVVCCLPLQCRRKTWPINPCFIFITNLGLFRLLGFAWVCCFCSSRKANKFKLNANTVIHTRVALTVFFHLRWHCFKIKISLREVKLGYHMCPLKKSGAESEEVLGSKNFSVFANQVFTFSLPSYTKTLWATRKEFPFISNKQSLQSRPGPFLFYSTFCRVVVFEYYEMEKTG